MAAKKKAQTEAGAEVPASVAFDVRPIMTAELQRQAEEQTDGGIVRLVGGRNLIDPAFLGAVVTGDRVAAAHRKIMDVVDPEWRTKMCIVGTTKHVGYTLVSEADVLVSLSALAVGAKKRKAKAEKTSKPKKAEKGEVESE